MVTHRNVTPEIDLPVRVRLVAELEHFQDGLPEKVGRGRDPPHPGRGAPAENRHPNPPKPDFGISGTGGGRGDGAAGPGRATGVRRTSGLAVAIVNCSQSLVRAFFHPILSMKERKSLTVP